MSIIQVGLVDKTGKLDPHLVQETAASLNVQVMRDLSKYWPAVQATVRYLTDPTHIPVGVWPVFLVASLPPGEGGVHLDKKNQPYSLVIGTPGSEDWTIDASHETLEMLVDPWGNKTQSSRAIKIVGNDVQDAPGEFDYLVEACDPCEANKYAYSINGIMVSDFITPNFYDPVAAASVRYSFGGNLERPRQLLPGGYISFTNPQIDEWQQILWLGSKPQLKNLGSAKGASIRAYVDGQTMAAAQKAKKPNKALAAATKAHRVITTKAAKANAAAYPV